MTSPSTFDRKLPIGFAVAAFIIGNGFVFVNPPLKAPDESAHFARAYRLTHLHPLPQVRDGVMGGYVPVGIENLRKKFESVSYTGASASQTIAAFHIPLEPDHVQFLYYPNISAYPFLPFIPQAVGIALGGIFFHSVLALMYCGRETNLIAYIAVVYAAVKLLPDGRSRLILTLIALLPMSMFQAASLSADTLTIAAALLVATTVWRMTFLQTAPSRFDKILLFAATLGLSLTKLAYAPLALLAIMIPARKFASRPKCAGFVASLLGCNALAIALWLWQFGGLPKIIAIPEVNPRLQEQYLLHHPRNILPLLIGTVRIFGSDIAIGVVGFFGWAEIPMPTPTVIIEYLVLLVAIGPGRPRYWPGAVVAVLTGAFNLFAMLIVYYIEWRPVGANVIDGFQGRYLLPLLPLAIFLAKPNPPQKYGRLILMVGVLIGAFAVIFLAQQAYPAFPASRFYFRFSNR